MRLDLRIFQPGDGDLDVASVEAGQPTFFRQTDVNGVFDSADLVCYARLD